MKKDLWQRAEELFNAALEQAPEARCAFLDKACGGDLELRRQVERLISTDEQAGSLLEKPALAGTMAEEFIMSGTKTLSHYQITDQIGKGGMGEVYRAKDQVLGRDVAIKILPEEFARDSDRVARFQREAKVLASLNHSNIAVIHGLEESGGTSFLVMELVEGQTLADRIKNGPIPVEESLTLALQIADALEAAHEKGVIHRDLKPANIKVTPEGKVKVLDFGLAKVFAGGPSDVTLAYSPTISEVATQQGILLGTAAYMSPEQARGKAVDKRADIWAFGCVLYEMLTGHVAFRGEDVSEILALVIKGDVNLDQLPANLHPRVREAIIRCLQKDLKRRYSGIADARYEIEQALADSGAMLTQPGMTAQPRKRLRTMLPWIAATAILGMIVGGFVVGNLEHAEPPQVTRFEYTLPEAQQFCNLTSRMLAVSPDGSQYVYVTPEGLYLRTLDEFKAKLIAGTGTNPANPFFSPDGEWIGYVADSKLKKIAIRGGEPITLCDASGFAGGSWGADNRIVYAVYQKGIYHISANSGTPEMIVKGNCYHPQILPDGKSVLFTSGPPPYKIVLQSLPSGERRELFAGDSARYISTGHVAYAEGSNLLARSFDLKTLKVTGESAPMVEGVWRSTNLYTPQYAVSDAGTLCYMPAIATGAAAQRTLVWVDRDGKEEPLTAPPDAYSNPRIDSDGTRVALFIVAAPPRGDIWIWDLMHRAPRRLTFDGTDIFPLWTPDGKRIAFFSARDGKYDAYWRNADGTGKDELLGLKLGLRAFVPADWADNGKTLVTTSWDLNYMSGIGILSMEGDRQFKFLLDEKHHEAQPRISRDGRWMAYTSSKSGREEIYVRPFHDVNAGLWQISTSGGNNPLWSPDGRELFYRNGNAVMAVSVETSTGFTWETSRILFQGTHVRSVNNPDSRDFGTWDINPVTRKFLMMKESSTGTGPRNINIVLNWTEELKQKVQAK
jgi:serine/threonine protein kinase/Tol biopolymer transport system component